MPENSTAVSSVSVADVEEKHFAFGRNWRNFLRLLDEDRIIAAENSLREMLRVQDLRGKRFLDIGCGSGLFSLAARRLGAEVTSFDYDPDSVGCAQELRRRFQPGDSNAGWRIEQGSALDKSYLTTLGQFDVVYSWGVLHHTGNMWQALENVITNVAPGGLLFISIYNEEGRRSKAYGKMKRFYNASPGVVRIAMTAAHVAIVGVREFAMDILRWQNPLGRYTGNKARGMSIWYDTVDWLGGWPFEVASPEALFEFYYGRGFDLVKLRTVSRGYACNEFVFRRRLG